VIDTSAVSTVCNALRPPAPWLSFSSSLFPSDRPQTHTHTPQSSLKVSWSEFKWQWERAGRASEREREKRSRDKVIERTTSTSATLQLQKTSKRVKNGVGDGGFEGVSGG